MNCVKSVKYFFPDGKDVKKKRLNMSKQQECAIKLETMKTKLLQFISIMTIEPMMFLQALAYKMIVVSENQMLLYKICREEHFNLTSEYCSSFEDHSNETSYKEVEKEANNPGISKSTHIIYEI